MYLTWAALISEPPIKGSFYITRCWTCWTYVGTT